MTQSAEQIANVVATLISECNYNFNRAGIIAGNLVLNPEDIDVMQRHVDFLVTHLKTVEAAIVEARAKAECLAEMIKQPATVS